MFYPLKFEIANRITALAESPRSFGCFECVTHMNNLPPYTCMEATCWSGLMLRTQSDGSLARYWLRTRGLDLRPIKNLERTPWVGMVESCWSSRPLNIKDHFMQRRRWIIGNLQNIENYSKLFKLRLIYRCTSFFPGLYLGHDFPGHNVLL